MFDNILLFLYFVLLFGIPISATIYEIKKENKKRIDCIKRTYDLFYSEANELSNKIKSSREVSSFMLEKYPQLSEKANILGGDLNNFVKKYKNFGVEHFAKNEESLKLLKKAYENLKECSKIFYFCKSQMEKPIDTPPQEPPQYTPPPQEPPKPRLSENERKLEFYENKQYLKADEIGRRYERYIGYLYEMEGYKVDYNGIKKGVKDGGIDLICSKGKYLTIIQCKCRDAEGQIHENTVLQLIANLTRYTRKNPKKSVAAILYTSHDNLDDEAKNALNDEIAEGAFIYHEIKPYDNSYPKVKCNIGDNGEKIYHLPDHSSMYDRIQIEIKKGEFFAKTIKEAESAGFRACRS